MNDVHFVNKKVEHLYNKYNISFLSKNKLFKHLWETCRKFKLSFEAAFDITFQINNTLFVIFMINNAKIVIIHFIAKLRDAIFRSNYNFRNWKYVTFKIRYSSNFEAEKNDISFDFECEITFDNRAYFLKNVFELEIKKMIFFISIRGVKNKVVNTNKYIMVTAYVNDVINNITKTACFTMKIHFINDFKINILLETNIITFQKITMNLKTRILKFGKC